MSVKKSFKKVEMKQEAVTLSDAWKVDVPITAF